MNEPVVSPKSVILHSIYKETVTMRNKKLQVWLPLIFSLVMIAGMFFGYQLGGKNKGKKFFGRENKNSLQEALDLIRMKYVDSVNLDSISIGAIEQMMNQLDPHSVYLPAMELKEANEDLAGNFEGIGVEFNIFSDTVNIIYVIPKSPGDVAGLKTGDKIIRVNDSLIAGKKIETDDVRKLIRGERGSKVELQIIRNNQLQKIQVTRGTIPVSSIDAAYMVDKTTGYIRLNKFSRNAYVEFMQSLEELQKQGMEKLIFDLRGNGGGFMDQATNIADEFLSDNKLIVYTEGLHSPKDEYKAKRPGLFEESKNKLVVLVDELTASASEVLAGAVQDWCRGKIIGRRSFGKGLVQLQYDLTDGSAMRLTVARYYTPGGRSIQRSYEDGKKVYMDEIWERYSSEESIHFDSAKYSNGKIYKTNCGDTVYGGGGIMPDFFVPADTNRFHPVASRLLINGSLNNFVYRYYLDNKTAIDNYSSPAEFNRQFSVSNDIWNRFTAFVKTDSVKLNTISAKEKTLLQLRLKAYLARLKWRSTGYFQVLNADDEMIRKGLEIIGKN
jgi:carboxyl-terminal processing protease